MISLLFSICSFLKKCYPKMNLLNGSVMAVGGARDFVLCTVMG